MKLLIIEDDIPFSNALARRLSKFGFETFVVNFEEDILSTCQQILPTHILLDMKLTTSSGLHFIQPLKKVVPNSTLVLLTGFASIATAVEAIKLGADDYLTKPANSQLIAHKLLGEISTEPSEEMKEIMSPERLEWEHIQQVLAANAGNVSETARQLSMHRRTLQRKLQKKPVQR